MWTSRLVLMKKGTAQKGPRPSLLDVVAGTQLAFILPFSTRTMTQRHDTNSTFDEPGRHGAAEGGYPRAAIAEGARKEPPRVRGTPRGRQSKQSKSLALNNGNRLQNAVSLSLGQVLFQGANEDGL